MRFISELSYTKYIPPVAAIFLTLALLLHYTSARLMVCYRPDYYYNYTQYPNYNTSHITFNLFKNSSVLFIIRTGIWILLLCLHMYVEWVSNKFSLFSYTIYNCMLQNRLLLKAIVIFSFIVHVKEMEKVLLDYPLFFIWGQF